jgi:superfamily I DNA/RNA helicase
MAGNAKPTEVIDAVFALRSKVGEKRTYLDLYKADDGGGSRRSENLEAMRDLAIKYDSVQEFVDSIERQETPEEYEDKEGRVQLMTVHRAKGLEFDTVFVVGFADGAFPHAMGDFEEERRIAYVAITRAEEHLIVTLPSMRNGKMTLPSPFLGTIGLNAMLRGDEDGATGIDGGAAGGGPEGDWNDDQLHHGDQPVPQGGESQSAEPESELPGGDNDALPEG